MSLLDYILLLVCGIAIVIGIYVLSAFAGFNNSRCYSPKSEQCQGRLRLDDCDEPSCQFRGRCKYEQVRE